MSAWGHLAASAPPSPPSSPVKPQRLFYPSTPATSGGPVPIVLSPPTPSSPTRAHSEWSTFERARGAFSSAGTGGTSFSPWLMRGTDMYRQAVSAAKDLLDPFSGALFREPVLAADGHTYEREQLERWLAGCGPVSISPATRAPMSPMFGPDAATMVKLTSLKAIFPPSSTDEQVCRSFA